MDADAPLQVSGSLVRSYVKLLGKLGHTSAVRKRLDGTPAAYLEDPSMPWSWVDGVPFIRLLEGVQAEQGDEQLRLTGAQVAREFLGALAAPLLRTVLTLSDTSPGALYKHLDTVSKPFIRGARFTFAERGPGECEVGILYPVRPAQAAFRLWQGVLLFPIEFTGYDGTVRPKVPFAEAQALYTIRWMRARGP